MGYPSIHANQNIDVQAWADLEKGTMKQPKILYDDLDGKITVTPVGQRDDRVLDHIRSSEIVDRQMLNRFERRYPGRFNCSGDYVLRSGEMVRRGDITSGKFR